MKKFYLDPKKLMMFSCHDGAANMVATSKILKVESFIHYTAHVVHLLLTTDRISQQEEITELLQKCKNIVTALHFKSLTMEDEIAAIEDWAIIAVMQQKLTNLNGLLEQDAQFPLSEEDSAQLPLQAYHGHSSLKSVTPKRWNSSLESLISLRYKVSNALKRSGKVDLCL